MQLLYDIKNAESEPQRNISIQTLHLLFMIYFYITAQKLLYNPYLPLPL